MMGVLGRGTGVYTCGCCDGVLARGTYVYMVMCGCVHMCAHVHLVHDDLGGLVLGVLLVQLLVSLEHLYIYICKLLAGLEHLHIYNIYILSLLMTET